MNNRKFRFGTLLVFLAAMTCTVVSAFAQSFNKEPKVRRSLEETLRMVEKMNRHENVYTTELDSVTMYGGDNMKVILDYDAHSNCTGIAIYYLDDEWEMEFAFEYGYDDQNRLTYVIDYDSEEKEEYIYNAQDLVEEIYRSSYQANGTWRFYLKNVLAYDEDNNMTLSMGYSYVEGEWVESGKQTWDYEDGLLQANTTYYINENGEWVGDRRIEYHYDGDSLCTEMIESYWSEAWYNESKTVYHYDAQQLCYEKIVYGYGEEWHELYKNSYEYDAAGNLHIEISYFHQSGTQDWTYRNKYEYLYDEDNNCTDYYEYFYYVYDETWELEEVYHIAYGTLGIEYISGLSLLWDLFEFSFPVSNKVDQLIMDEDGDYFYFDFHYSSTDGIEEQNGNVLTLWPNPAMDRVVVEGIEAAEVQVYNGLGQMVKTVRNSNEISVAGLAEGVYLVRITNAMGVSQTERVTVIK